MNLFFSDIHRRELKAGLLITLAAAAGCSDQGARFEGIWKSDCEDYWGVQILPIDRDLYAVTFCGLSGCLSPGEWAPNTHIEDDPMYQVVSTKKIRIRRTDGGYFTYIKCTADPAWQTR